MFMWNTVSQLFSILLQTSGKDPQVNRRKTAHVDREGLKAATVSRNSNANTHVLHKYLIQLTSR